MTTPSQHQQPIEGVLVSPNGTRYRLAVANNGTLSAVAVPATDPGAPPSDIKVRPEIANFTQSTKIRIDDAATTFTTATQVGVYDGATQLLVASVTPNPAEPHTLTATLPAGKTNGAIKTGRTYDIKVLAGASVLATYSGATGFTGSGSGVLSPGGTTPEPGSVTINPNSGSMRGSTNVTISDPGTDLSTATQVGVYSGATQLLVASANPADDDAHTVEVAIPAGNTNVAQVKTGRSYDLKVLAGASTLATYSGAFSFVS